MIIINEAWKITLDKYSIRVLKAYQIWVGFFILAKLNGGGRSARTTVRWTVVSVGRAAALGSATLTGMKQRQNGKSSQR